MSLSRQQLEELVYGREWGRYTQDSPIMPDVWFAFGEDPAGRRDLLLEPYKGVRPGRLAEALLNRFGNVERGPRPTELELAYDEGHVVARLTFRELVGVALPLSKWWQNYPGPLTELSLADIASLLKGGPRSGADQSRGAGAVRRVTDHGRWFLRVAGSIELASRPEALGTGGTRLNEADVARAAHRLLQTVRSADGERLLWSVNLNRPASIAVSDSRRSVKADAAERVFDLGASHLTWAILDTGIDARHPAFRLRKAGGLIGIPKGSPRGVTRVRDTYDFTAFRSVVAKALGSPGQLADLHRSLRRGRTIDWETIAPLLKIEHDAKYRPPAHPHGTHVAGILGADWRRTDPGYDADPDDDLRGMCPDIGLLDLRVFDHTGRGDEFAILAALQYVRFLNDHSPQQVIHGVNLSLSIPHDVSNFGCGSTPVCNEVERLHSSGVVVVAAAGNDGYLGYLTDKGKRDGYRTVSITDPGNAPAAITVGSTHGRRPHTFGVSYFSSRGPTGDGRLKPDLVAPGEKIRGPAPDGGYARLDGTSMAAPHVSGAAALLMARHAELIGQPQRIKAALCATATDLGRERYFQGAGLVDVLRALQSF